MLYRKLTEKQGFEVIGQTIANSSSTRRNMSRYIKTFVQIAKLITEADSNMPPSAGIMNRYEHRCNARIEQV